MLENELENEIKCPACAASTRLLKNGRRTCHNFITCKFIFDPGDPDLSEKVKFFLNQQKLNNAWEKPWTSNTWLQPSL